MHILVFWKMTFRHPAQRTQTRHPKQHEQLGAVKKSLEAATGCISHQHFRCAAGQQQSLFADSLRFLMSTALWFQLCACGPWAAWSPQQAGQWRSSPHARAMQDKDIGNVPSHSSTSIQLLQFLKKLDFTVCKDLFFKLLDWQNGLHPGHAMQERPPLKARPSKFVLTPVLSFRRGHWASHPKLALAQDLDPRCHADVLVNGIW
eukprot:6485215-Amphidinium_carterae.3